MGYDNRIKTSNEQKHEAIRLAEITNQADTLAFLQKVFNNSVANGWNKKKFIGKRKIGLASKKQ